MSSATTTEFAAGRPLNSVRVLSRAPGSQRESSESSTVFVVDGEMSERESLELLISREGSHAKTFASVPEFLRHVSTPVASCLILELSQDSDGLDLQKRLSVERPEMPIILITPHNDARMAVRAIKAGAIEFLTKPFTDDVLSSAIRQALQRSRAVLDHEMKMRDLRNRYALLTPRERQVMALVVAGMLNKQVGGELGISEKTVKAHRGQVMQKMKAYSLADLVRMAADLQPARMAMHFA